MTPPAERREFPGLAPLGGALAGLALAIILLSSLPFPYRPYDGTVGPPAFYGFSPSKKVWGYWLFTALPIVGALAGRLAMRGRSRERVSGFTFAIGAGLFALAIPLLPPEFIEFISPSLRSGAFWLQLAIAVACGAWLARVPRGATTESAGAAIAGNLRLRCWIAVIALHLWVAFAPAFDSATIAVALAAIFAALFIAPLGCVAGESREACAARAEGFWTRAESVAWRTLAAFPLTALWLRFRKSFDLPLETPPGYAALALGCAAAALACSAARCRSGARCRVSPTIFIPFLACAMFAGAAYPTADYDPYHQAEYIYPYRALASGLLPYRDIFFVHGFGFNVIAGWAMDGWLRAAPNVDVVFLNLVAASGILLVAWLYLRLWGERWWPMALALAALGGCAAATKGGRYVPFYMFALAAGRYAQTGRARWAAMAGGVASAAAVYSLDTGAVALASGVAWLALLALRPLADQSTLSLGVRLKPLGAFALGAGVVGGAFLAWLASLGALGDFFSVNLAYARMKAHYDSLPFPATGLSYFLSPLLTIFAAAALSRRASWRGDALDAMTLLFALANFLAFMRGLDRSDEGHLVYATMLAWPLLGCLVARQARDASAGEAFARGAAVAVLVAALPFAAIGLRGAGPAVVIDPIYMARLYQANCRRAFTQSAANSIASDPFFSYCYALEKAAGAGSELLDLTNRPGLYVWARLRCPTRFYANYYATSLEWQNEAIASLEARKTPWVLFPGRIHGGRRIDGIDIQLRQWALVRYVLKNYEPAVVMRDKAVLMRRVADGAAPAPIAGEFREALVGPIDMGEVKSAWAHAKPGGPAPEFELQLSK